MPIFNKREDIFALIDKFEKSALTEIEIEIEDDIRISMKKQVNFLPSMLHSEITAKNIALQISDTDTDTDEIAGEDEIQNTTSGTIVKAPLIGVYYSAPSPDSEPFVEVGKKISKGTVLCIIEAMKAMNDIESEIDGEIAEIFVKNTQTVEFGQPLFRIK
jgi:acetyl-CoA carboxylase biotin carboxyl carrier protein